VTHNYTAEQEAVIKDSTIPHNVAAEQLGVSEATIRRRRKDLGVAVTRHRMIGPDAVAAVSREELLEAENRELKAQARAGRKQTVAQERILDAIERELANAGLTFVEPIALPPRRQDDAHHRQAVLLSDWHLGEVVNGPEVGGLNVFNYAVLEERVNRIVTALLAFKRVRPELTGLDLWFMGDMVSGNIHDELAQTNEFPVAEQSVRAGKLMAALIVELAPHYPDLYCIGIPGNHARTQKPHASKQVFDSWDWTAYQLAAALTSRIANVEWEIPSAGTTVREIAGRKILLFHGDGIKSSMPGVPWGGVMRRSNELRKQYAEMGIRLDGFALGHFHQCNVVQGSIFMNGSVIGTNEYGYKNFGGGESPKQLLLTFDEKRNRLTDNAYLDLG
jgi:hypothetical protein